jgi:hypothetical protein
MQRSSLFHPYFIVAIIIGFSFSPNYNQYEEERSCSQTPLEKLMKRKKWIDDYRQTKGADMKILVGFEADSNLVTIVNWKYPPGYNRRYNIVKDNNGRVIFSIEAPMGKNDDWDINHCMYYDEAGNLFAYMRETTFLNSNCTEKYAFEKITYYYGNDLKILKSNYELTDFYNKPLKKELCQFPYNFKYDLLFTYKEFAASRKIDRGR